MTAMRSLNRPHGYKHLITAGIWIESTMGLENKNQLGTWNTSKQEQNQQFESIQVSFLGPCLLK
jgi:hypothetical protein